MICKRYITNFKQGADQFVNESKLSKRVNEWTRKIEPILREQEDGPQFDIHTYADILLTDIIQTSIGDIPNEEVSFRDIVQGKSRSEVCRVFLACLQLVNSGNVSIVSDPTPTKLTKSGGKGNHTKGAVVDFQEVFRIRLLVASRKGIEDFLAPSVSFQYLTKIEDIGEGNNENEGKAPLRKNNRGKGARRKTLRLEEDEKSLQLNSL
jgi:hypothetical protein